VVIVRGDQAVPPAGARRLNAGDTLHLLVREEVAWRIPELIDRLGAAVTPPRTARRRYDDELDQLLAGASGVVKRTRRRESARSERRRSR
jgi:hypothetical protein